jgi:phenylpropionate dioxygenase-like ring-hydroxylating dioxygenase large terminal subunit
LKIDRIYAGSYPCEERDDFIWVFIPDPSPAGAGFSKPAAAPVPAPEIPKFSEHYKLAYLTADLPCSVDHGIIGLMDPAHGPFVHQAWWWRSQKSIHEKHKNFEPIPYGFRMSAHTPSSNSAPYKLLRLYADADSITTTIDFVLPNLRSEIIRAGKYWFSSLTTVTPITRNQCRIDVVAAWNLIPLDSLWPPVAEIRLRKIRGAGSPHHGASIRGLEAQPAPDADRRRRPPRKVVFRFEKCHAGDEEERAASFGIR